MCNGKMDGGHLLYIVDEASKINMLGISPSELL